METGSSALVLPREGSSFVGRAAETEALGRLVAEGARLVTLVGAGGVGKTRLAVEWARAAEGSLLQAGARLLFCDLSAAATTDDACAALARALGAPLAAAGSVDDAIAQVGRALADLDRAVVVLDNLEQLAHLAPRLLSPWLALAPHAQIVVTSRERLRLREERCLAVEPLDVPAAGDAPSAIAASEAVQLFVARSRAVRSDFGLAGADAPVVAAVVRALEGLPLAIELCAARAGILAPAQILPLLSRRLDLLVTGARDAPARHATLRAAIAWSWDLLETWEKEALAQCSVFRGGFSLEAALAVIDPGPGAPPVIDVLQSLYEKSLVRAFDPAGRSEAPALVDAPAARRPGAAARRYGLFESVRAFAEERLAERRGAAAAEARHAAFFVGRTGTPLPRVADVAHLAPEVDNLVAVCRRALDRGSPADTDVALRALLHLEPVFLASAAGRLDPYAADLDAALARADPPVDRAVVARALYTRAIADFLRGRVIDCFAGFQRALDAAHAAGSRMDAGLALTKLGLMLEHADRPDEARARFDEARSIARALADPLLDADWLLTRGGALTWLGRAGEAAAHHAEAVEKFLMAGDPRGASMAAGQLALAHLNQGRFADAEDAAERSLSLLAGRGEQRTEGYVLGMKARVCHAQGRFDEARAMLSTALAIHRAVGDRWSEGVHLGYVGNVAFEERRFADARAAYRDAVTKLRGTGERHYTAIYLAALGAAEISAGAPAAAAACFEDAAAALAGVRVQATRVDVALWAAFADVGRDRHVAAAPIALAEAPAPDGGASVARNSEDVRFALRMLARALAEAGATALPAAPPVAPTAPRSATQPLLVIGPDARWFRVEGREPVSLFKARAARLILARLAGLRLASPGAALPLEALFEAGWPGERIAPKAAANRVYVTLSKLKSLGLRGLIVSRDDGFLIDPAAVVLEAIGAGEAGSGS